MALTGYSYPCNPGPTVMLLISPVARCTMRAVVETARVSDDAESQRLVAITWIVVRMLVHVSALLSAGASLCRKTGDIR